MRDPRPLRAANSRLLLPGRSKVHSVVSSAVGRSLRKSVIEATDSQDDQTLSFSPLIHFEPSQPTQVTTAAYLAKRLARPAHARRGSPARPSDTARQ